MLFFLEQEKINKVIIYGNLFLHYIFQLLIISTLSILVKYLVTAKVWEKRQASCIQ